MQRWSTDCIATWRCNRAQQDAQVKAKLQIGNWATDERDLGEDFVQDPCSRASHPRSRSTFRGHDTRRVRQVGFPKVIRVNEDTEYVSRELDPWASQPGPGSEQPVRLFDLPARTL
jgi:hypothetical protein